MRNLILTLFFCLLLWSCGGDDVETIQDNISRNTDIASVAESAIPELSEGNKLFVDGKIEEAIDFYKEGIKANRSLAFYNIGVSYYLLGDYQNSEMNFRLALEEQPDFEQAKINLSASLLHLNRLNEAEQLIKEISSANASAKVLVNAANVFLKKGNTAEAYYYYEQAHKVSPEMPFVKLSFGNFLISVGDFERGIAILDEFEDKDYNIYFNLARGHFVQKNYDDTIRMIKEAIEKEKTVEAYVLLALAYNETKDYALAAAAYSWVIKLENTWDYQYQYARFLFLSGDWQRSRDILYRLLRERPQSVAAYQLLYKLLDQNNQRAEAFKVAKTAYQRIKDDRILYMYVRDVIVYGKKYKFVRPLLFNKRQSDYLNLGRSLYAIKTGQFQNGLVYLSAIKDVNHNDYYVYKTFLNVKLKEYASAAVNVEKIEQNRYEYLWLSFVIHWNTKNRAELLRTVYTGTKNITKFNHKPKVRMSLIPVASDLDFAYRFNEDMDSFVRLLLTPYAINPDEMLSFLALGYKLLEDDEKLKALSELKKSVVFSNGVEVNNDGVQAFYQGDYLKALRSFEKSESLIKKNPIILYNMGVAWLSLGNKDKAFGFFDKSVLFSRFMFPAYLGKATVLEMRGQHERALFEYDNVINNVSVFKTSSDVQIPGSFLYSEYLANVAVGKVDKAIQDIITLPEKNDYLYGLAEILSYLQKKNIQKIQKIDQYAFFRKELILHLLSLFQNQPPPQVATAFKDRFSKYILNYASLVTTGRSSADFAENDSVILNEKILSMILQNDRNKALTAMQKLSNTDFRFPSLYKSSNYYFLWQRDFLNAEASALSYLKLGKPDIYSDYYRLLFFLLNYNEKRLQKYINSFIEDHPVDPRGLVVDALNAFKSNRLKRLNNDLLSLEQLDPNFMDKVSLVIDIDGL